MSLGVTLCSLSTLLKLRANPPHKVLKARKLKKKCVGIRDANYFCLFSFSLTTGCFLKANGYKNPRNSQNHQTYLPNNFQVQTISYPLGTSQLELCSRLWARYGSF